MSTKRGELTPAFEEKTTKERKRTALNQGSTQGIKNAKRKIERVYKTKN
jgi:hypothetical protein